MLRGSSAPPSGTQSGQRRGGPTFCFMQNLFHLALPPAIGPTWSLAIEEQYYFLWAPVVRFLRAPWMLATLLVGALIASPLFRRTHFAWITPTHTLTHIDGIAMGSLLALGLYTLPLSRRVWLWIGLAAMPIGFLAAATIAGGTAFLDTALTTLFAGAVLSSIASTGARNPDQCNPQSRSARLLRPHQLRPLHDPHHGLHLLRLVRCPHGSLRHFRQPRRRSVPPRRLHARCHHCSGTDSNREFCASSATSKTRAKKATVRPELLALTAPQHFI